MNFFPKNIKERDEQLVNDLKESEMKVDVLEKTNAEWNDQLQVKCQVN
jgi:hypothetical protein